MWRSAKLSQKPKPGEMRRKFFRHELASALGVLHPDAPVSAEGIERDLVAYLIAAHHGKVRLSIRSLPGEWPAPDAARFARGVWDGDLLPAAFLGGESGTEVTAPAVTLSLEPMELGLGQESPFVGLPSWSERMLTLRDTIGIFRLAYLEALLRAADERASALAK
jgi:CRISPR-associated endonuclease/helicase Cas3